jgi:hypothetical protein
MTEEGSREIARSGGRCQLKRSWPFIHAKDLVVNSCTEKNGFGRIGLWHVCWRMIWRWWRAMPTLIWLTPVKWKKHRRHTGAEDGWRCVLPGNGGRCPPYGAEDGGRGPYRRRRSRALASRISNRCWNRSWPTILRTSTKKAKRSRASFERAFSNLSCWAMTAASSKSRRSSKV